MSLLKIKFYYVILCFLLNGFIKRKKNVMQLNIVVYSANTVKILYKKITIILKLFIFYIIIL